MMRGEARGVAVSSLGTLFLAPRITPIGGGLEGAFQSQVFGAAADDAGNVLLGTGPEGQVIRIDRTGKESVLFRAPEPLVTALLPLLGGEILAATAPGGKIYRLRPDGTGRYVWALAAAPNDSVLAATGDRGRLLKIDRNGNPSVIFDGEEAHLVSLAASPEGGVWAGGAGRGLVYRIDADGRGLAVYDDELPEAKSIAVTREGDLVVAFDAPPASDKRPPAFRLRVAGGSAGAGGAGEAMNELDARRNPGLQGVIEGLPSYSEDEPSPLRGKLVRLARGGGVTELWRSRSDAAFAVALDDRGRVLFATGEPARVWRVEGPGETALLATLDEAQATAFASLPSSLILATSNPAATYRIDPAVSDSGTFLAPPADAGGLARWGTLSWRLAQRGGRVALSTRTGNSEVPDGTWSPWGPPQADPRGGPMTSSEGRYSQWRAQLETTSGDGPRVVAISATYSTVNQAPTIKDLRIEPANSAVSAKATFRYATADPDGDDVSVTIQARTTETSPWKDAAFTDPPSRKPSDPSLGNDGASKDGKASWDTTTWDEGVYELRAVASDQPSNPEGAGLEAEATLDTLVDRTPPRIAASRKGDAIAVQVSDALSAVARLEVMTDGRVLFSPRCGDGVCDAPDETFTFRVPAPSPGDTWKLRATDLAGNEAVLPVPAP
jgi:hypothetical protein